jgi:hypothetical protein
MCACDPLIQAERRFKARCLNRSRWDLFPSRGPVVPCRTLSLVFATCKGTVNNRRTSLKRRALPFRLAPLRGVIICQTLTRVVAGAPNPGSFPVSPAGLRSSHAERRDRNLAPDVRAIASHPGLSRTFRTRTPQGVRGLRPTMHASFSRSHIPISDSTPLNGKFDMDD